MSDTHNTGRYAHMTAAQVIAEQERLMAVWAADDEARRARNAALLASL